MIRKVLLPLLAAMGFAFAVYTVHAENRPVTPAQPVAPPPKPPFESYVAGAGIIEASSDNIAVGTTIPGVITDVYIKVGQRIKAGDPLFKIDDRALRAERAVREAALAVAKSNLQKLENQPRPEDIPPAEARVREAEAALADMKNTLKLWESVTDKRAISEDELSKRRFAVATAEARLAEAKSQLDLLKAGAWKPDIEIARAQVTSAQAQLDATKTDLDRLTVRALVDGVVLQRNIRPGEYAQAGVLATPLVMIGDVERLHVRVDVDENDAWRIRKDAPAVAFVRGNSALKTDLKFSRLEPFVVPKKSLTGDSTERVDTRVLQIIYSFDADALPVYVGQQMDVFIKAPPASDVLAATRPAGVEEGAK